MTATRRVVQVEIDLVEAELAADALWQAGPSAVGEEDIGDGRVRLTADIADARTVGALPGGAVVRVLALDSEDYLDRWRAWAGPVRAGRRVVIHPAWLPVDPGTQGDLLVVIDPGRAFGSGSHPSTRLVVAAMEEHLRGGARVLDVGTGSGVLAVTGCLLGAAEVVAIDIDPRAVAVTQANALANGVEDRVVVSTTPLEEVSGPFDVVVANIGAAVLVDLADDLLRLLDPHGVLVLAGLLDDQADRVARAVGSLRERSRLSEDGWTTLVVGGP